MNQAADAGYSFAGVMGGETAFGGSELVAVMRRDLNAKSTGRKKYKVLVTNLTSTMQKEIQKAGDEGFEYLGQTVYNSAFAGRQVIVILQLDSEKAPKGVQYKLLTTSKTGNMEKVLKKAGDEGFDLLGMTVGKTAMGGNELLCFLRKVE